LEELANFIAEADGIMDRVRMIPAGACWPLLALAL